MGGSIKETLVSFLFSLRYFLPFSLLQFLTFLFLFLFLISPCPSLSPYLPPSLTHFLPLFPFLSPRPPLQLSLNFHAFKTQEIPFTHILQSHFIFIFRTLQSQTLDLILESEEFSLPSHLSLIFLTSFPSPFSPR